ncbi:hypothetical protein Tco_1420018 [Tanacetum coccineum]
MLKESVLIFERIISPVARLELSGLFVALLHTSLFQLSDGDLKMAFLICPLKEEVFVHNQRFVDPDHPDKVLPSKESSIWMKTRSEELISSEDRLKNTSKRLKGLSIHKMLPFTWVSGIQGSGFEQTAFLDPIMPDALTTRKSTLLEKTVILALPEEMVSYLDQARMGYKMFATLAELSSQAVNKSPTHYPCDSARTFRVILFSIHNDEWKSFQCHHQTALRIHKDGDGDASFQLESDSLPHAHAQTTKTYYSKISHRNHESIQVSN